MKREVYKMKVDTPVELLAIVLCVAECKEKREDQLRRTIVELRTELRKCIVVGCGDFRKNYYEL
jgi:phage regulator Rha-like protein